MYPPTNQCRIVARLQSGATVEGTLHVSADASAVIRPADVVRDMKSGMLLLSNVEIREPKESRRCSAVVIPREAIILIELPDEGWTKKPPLR